ncbi:MAG TPA: ROK family protein [Bryobacteraceae bacterium]|jgi:fructokinase|nr:ROK family protein [Bryobacteraceae bacterium]
MLGAIEAGGTKFVCAVGTGPEDLETIQIPTGEPRETVAAAIEFFRFRRDLRAVGIASFGPVDLEPGSSTYGHITSTPKTGWRDFDLVGSFRRELALPVGFDTDVNGAALGEARWGAAQGLSDFLYLTVGTGIGGGAMVNGRLVHGLIHPEMGHIRVPHDRAADPYPGCCPFHGDCLEGLASGPAVRGRWGRYASELPPDHPGLALEARYLALGLATWVCTLSPRRIVLGGGVMEQQRLLPLIRCELAALLNGYIQAPCITAGAEQYVVPARLGPRAGVLGALVLAEFAASQSAGAVRGGQTLK